MIPSHQSLVSLHPEREAVIKAIALVSEKRERDPDWRADGFPWVRTFMRLLTGDGRVTSRNINRIGFVQWSAKCNLSTLKDWEAALDYLIATKGERCPPPISADVQQRLFPEVAFQRGERVEKRRRRRVQQHQRREDRADRQAELKHQNRVAQAGIDLAFCTPENLSAWYEHWSGQGVREWELERMVWAWVSRFPSLSEMEPLEWRDEPLWAVVGQVRRFAEVRDGNACCLDAWLVPNKLSNQQENI
ncbi:plasmid SOS inhibition protein A [Klebsiella aerogenes]|uniref:plasmid SOS inhibition protein A n=1 Tax=Klebsiella aerogenes TaxID=548 RepID=UPI002E34690D|nr:plasmid SOS inhibition protein A [Klebsiella aerogenes]MED7793142.1 plasmid SOS inhibition protein A [Klebsiella aerogenes]